MSPNQQEPPTVSFSHSQALPADASPYEFHGHVWALHYPYLPFMLMSAFHCEMTSRFSTPPLCTSHITSTTNSSVFQWVLPLSIGTPETQTFYNLTPKFRWFQTPWLWLSQWWTATAVVSVVHRLLPSSQNSTILVPWHLQPKLLSIQSPAYSSISQQVNQLILSFKIPLLYELYYRCFL